MKLAIGQRWQYTWDSYDFILEIVSVTTSDDSYAQCVIIQANQFSMARNFAVGRIDNWKLQSNRDLNYLEGQDKPQ
jgi:hypothetical protein